MQYDPKFWPLTTTAAVVAIVAAAAGLALNAFAPAAPALLTSGLLALSLAGTAVAFGRVAMRLRRLELENEGLVEEISQEFDSVKDKLEIFSEALEEPRSLEPEAAESHAAPMRRVMVK